MAVYMNRKSLLEALQVSVERIEAARHKLDADFEREKDDWIRPSPQRNRKEDRVDEALSAVDRALKEMRAAISAIKPQKASTSA